VVVDLGGDTAFNVLDLFLAADHQVVMTTSEPASYLEAYTFIKVALYRKLNRMFSDSPEFMDHRDAGLEKIIREGTDSGSGLTATSVGELKNRIDNASHRHLIDRLTNSFRPGLVVNRASAASDPLDIVRRISTVAEKKFATRVTHLGTIPHSPDVELSARSLVPEVARHPEGALAQTIGTIISNMHRCSLNSSAG
jgi:flagellar biosynthesis protein FlhG